jgi:hypothetical protein
MDRMADRGEYHPSLAEVVGPPGNRLGAQILELQPIDILRFQNDVLRVLIVGHVVLLIVDHERAHPFRDGMFVRVACTWKGRSGG